MFYLYLAKTGGSPNWGKIGVIIAIIVPAFSILVAAISAYVRLNQVEKTIDNEIKPDIKSLRSVIDKASNDLAGRIDSIHTTLVTMKVEQSGAVKGDSPRALTPKGEKILEESGIKGMVESKLGDIISIVKARKPENEYRTEQYVIEAVRDLGKDPAFKEQIEEGAFNSGTTVDVLLFVAAIYIRDQVIAAVDQK